MFPADMLVISDVAVGPNPFNADVSIRSRLAELLTDWLGKG
jgi:hypothetical protein